MPVVSRSHYPGCAPSQLVTHPQPACWQDKRKSRKGLDTVSANGSPPVWTALFSAQIPALLCTGCDAAVFHRLSRRKGEILMKFLWPPNWPTREPQKELVKVWQIQPLWFQVAKTQSPMVIPSVSVLDLWVRVLVITGRSEFSVKYVMHRRVDMLWHLVLYFTSVILFLGRKPEEEGVEDNGLEENSRDGQASEIMVLRHPLTFVICNKYTSTLFLSVGWYRSQSGYLARHWHDGYQCVRWSWNR